MSVASVDRIFPLHIPGTVTLGATLVLAAAAAGTVPVPAAIAIAGVGSAVVPAVAMISRACTIHRMASSGRAVPSACRCAGFFGLGVLASGLTVAALPVAGFSHWPALATGGLTVTAVLFTVGLLFVPGVAASTVGRLRQAMDGLVIGGSLALAGWLLLPHVGAAHPCGCLTAVVAAAYASIAGTALLRAGHHRPVTARCGIGTALAIVGLALLVIAIGREVAQWAVLAAAAPVVAGPPLTWAGVRRTDPAAPESRPARLDKTFGGYPMLAVPIGAAVLATAYHLIAFGPPGRGAVMLAIGVGVALTAREILATTDLRRFAHRLAVQEARLRALVTGTSDVTMVLDDRLVVRWLSPAAAHQFGLTDRDLAGRALTERIHPDDAAAFADQLRQVAAAGGGRAGGFGAAREPDEGHYDGPALVEARMRDGTGRWRETESTISDLRTLPAVRAIVVQMRDVGQRRNLERAIRRLASTDRRTGLPNRRELLRAIAARRGAGPRAGALIVAALYGLTAINDLDGRSAGDAILVEAARRIRQQVGTDDLPSRLGESQFAVVTADGPIEAHALAVRLLSALTTPYPLACRPPVQLQTSVGITGLSGGGSADEVVRRGSLALRRASQLGRNRIEWYDESLEEQLVRRLDLERHLPGAAGRDELDLAYQPVVQLAGERPVGVAALLRWRHPVLGTVLPDELLPVADKSRVSSEIAQWVLHTACRQVGGWRRGGHDLWLTVCVSAAQLADPELVPEVAAALSVHETPPERLVVEMSNLEISERSECAPVAGLGTGNLPMIAAQFSKLRALGVRTALADFGTGHTDLTRLRRLPLDLVKLASASTAGSAGELAAAVVHLTRRLGLTVVADGLESEAQRELVRAAGCRYGQGRVVVPPAPAERFEAYLESQRARSH
jgi:diguanylate cyclase (GGDEF)-like protein